MASISEGVKAAILADLRATIGTPEGSCRKVAARHGVGMTTARNVAKSAGLSFAPDARARTKHASEVTALTNAQRREALSARMLARAEALEASLDQEVYVYSFGGKDGLFSDATARRPSPQDAKHIMTSAGIAFDKHRMLETFDSAGASGQQADLVLRLLTGDVGA